MLRRYWQTLHYAEAVSYTHLPHEELVFSHGDISNFFICNDEIYFFDLARCGTADKWLDISMCVREIRNFFHNSEFEKLFFEMLGMEPNLSLIHI